MENILTADQIAQAHKIVSDASCAARHPLARRAAWQILKTNNGQPIAPARFRKVMQGQLVCVAGAQ